MNTEKKFIFVGAVVGFILVLLIILIPMWYCAEDLHDSEQLIKLCTGTAVFVVLGAFFGGLGGWGLYDMMTDDSLN